MASPGKKKDGGGLGSHLDWGREERRGRKIAQIPSLECGAKKKRNRTKGCMGVLVAIAGRTIEE